MKLNEINNSISTLPGVGSATAQAFARLNVFTIGDLLSFFPKDYEDRTLRIPIESALRFPKVHTIAQVTGHEWFGYGNMRTLKLNIKDLTGKAQLIAFNRPYYEKAFPQGSIISVSAKFELKYNILQSTQFEIEKIADSGNLDAFQNTHMADSKIIALYHLTEGLSQKIVSKAIKAAINQFSLGIENELPEEIIKKRSLISKAQAIKWIHCPQSMLEVKIARNTLVYEELFNFQKAVALQSISHRGKLPSLNSFEAHQKPVSIQEFERTLSPRQKQLYSRLPFELTPDQCSVIYSMNTDIDQSYNGTHSMRALLQGDVGSGKTLVSFFAALRVIDYGSQAAFMAPTELLAKQHAENAAILLEPSNVRVAFLTGNINAKGRLLLLNELKNGNIDIIIGTHALFSKNVHYKDLAFTIIDEQHRFGVMQRSAIMDKGRTSIAPKLKEPNLLMMSATPIPQTLALTMFGDLDVLTIHTKPSGRKDIITYLTKEGNEKNAYEAVRKELQKGHQAYFVYPAIEDDKDALKSVEKMYDYLSRQIYPEYKTALVHGKIDEDLSNQVLTDFRAGKIQILIATTVVEVGVDVPNASCMVIEQADHFGLAALHQLRGRVGRGCDQSYCFLIYSKNISKSGIERMKVLHETTDGFKIAEEDLKLRGPGEITGRAQSGELTFALANPFYDQEIMLSARTDVFELLSNHAI